MSLRKLYLYCNLSGKTKINMCEFLSGKILESGALKKIDNDYFCYEVVFFEVVTVDKGLITEMNIYI